MKMTLPKLKAIKRNNIFINIILLMMLTGCAKYQVVSELKVNLYHLHNPKKREVKIILTEQKLEVGKFYRLNSIKTIEIDEK